MKAEDHVAGLSNNDQMLTFENTDQTIKKYETYAASLIDTKTTVCLLLAGRLRMTTALKATTSLNTSICCERKSRILYKSWFLKTT